MDQIDKNRLAEIADLIEAALDSMRNDQWDVAIEKIDKANDKMGSAGTAAMNLDPSIVGKVDRLNGEFWEHNLGTQRTTVARTVEFGNQILREMRDDRHLSMRNYFVTFGQKYRHEQHPVSLDGVRPHPDGWVLIRCGNQSIADRTAHALFGTRFSIVYSEETHSKHLYPMGELFSIKIEENR